MRRLVTRRRPTAADGAGWTGSQRRVPLASWMKKSLGALMGQSKL
jgi:hypothetical protein